MWQPYTTLMASKRQRDDVDSLAKFMADLNSYKVVNEYLELNGRVSSNFVSAVIDRLTYWLYVLFLDQLADQNLLNSKES